jgi:serine phosphatase RsbU (regulator of sigma subunit)
LTIHQASTALLATIPRVMPGVCVHVIDGDGGAAITFGAGTGELVQALLGAVAARERLESDMQSVLGKFEVMQEQLYSYADELPKISSGDETQIASGGAEACQRATRVRRVIYLGYQPGKNSCEEGFLAEVLSGDGVVVCDVPAGGRLGEPGSAEHLARSQVLGVPVKFGADDKRFLIGALLLIDKLPRDDQPAGHFQRFDHEEWQIAASYAAILGAVLGARKLAELKKEMKMAETIQRQILPQGPPSLAGFDVAASCLPCGAVGGDYYDYVPLADGRTLVVIADVSGHNLASGMIMVSACSMLRTLASMHREPAQVFEELAARMHGDLTRTERFLTAAAVAMRPGDGSVDFVSAGHNDLFVYRAATDRVERVASEGTILGFVACPTYAQRHLVLSPGDCLLLYTDGITEAMDDNGEMYGEERLAHVFARLAPDQSARRILDGIVEDLERYRRGQVGADDVTAVVLRYGEPGARP